jgi:hypothetical protein
MKAHVNMSTDPSVFFSPKENAIFVFAKCSVFFEVVQFSYGYISEPN